MTTYTASMLSKLMEKQAAQPVEPVAYVKATANQFNGYECCAKDDPNAIAVYATPPDTAAEMARLRGEIKARDKHDDFLVASRDKYAAENTKLRDAVRVAFGGIGVV